MNDNKMSTGERSPSEVRGNLFLLLITLTQLVQMIPLGVGINSGLALAAAVGGARINSAWIVASYPLTQGSFVLIGEQFEKRSGFSIVSFSSAADLGW